MSKSIKISPKHGVNPTIPICFWCGENKNEIALMGRIDKEDSEAPRNILMDYEPCDKCQEAFKQGTHVIGISTKPFVEGQHPIMSTDNQSFYPSGTYFVATEQWVRRVINSEEEQEKILKKGALLMDDTIVKQIVGQIQEMKEES